MIHIIELPQSSQLKKSCEISESVSCGIFCTIPEIFRRFYEIFASLLKSFEFLEMLSVEIMRPRKINV